MTVALERIHADTVKVNPPVKDCNIRLFIINEATGFRVVTKMEQMSEIPGIIRGLPARLFSRHKDPERVRHLRIRSLHTDYGSEFINETMALYKVLMVIGETEVEPLDFNSQQVVPSETLTEKQSQYANECREVIKQGPCMYGKWVEPILKDIGFVQTTVDPCLWMFPTSEPPMLMARMVDDHLLASTPEQNVWVVDQLRAKGVPIEVDEPAHLYVGVEIRKEEGGAYALTQEHYVEKILVKHGLEDVYPRRSPLETKPTPRPDDGDLLDTTEHHKYCSCVGSLMYLALRTGASKETRHIDIRRFALREFVATGVATVERVPGKDNLADMLTKAQVPETLEYQRDKIVVPIKRDFAVVKGGEMPSVVD